MIPTFFCGRTDALVRFCGLTVFFITVSLEILYIKDLIADFRSGPFGLAVFAVSHVLSVLQGYNRAVQSVSGLTQKNETVLSEIGLVKKELTMETFFINSKLADYITRKNNKTVFVLSTGREIPIGPTFYEKLKHRYPPEKTSGRTMT